jgi:hypothetical protein
MTVLAGLLILAAVLIAAALAVLGTLAAAAEIFPPRLGRADEAVSASAPRPPTPGVRTGYPRGSE